MKKTILILLAASLLMVPSSLYASRADQLYKKAAANYHRLYKNTKFRTLEHNWLNTIKQFDAIYKTYPRHAKASAALFNMAKLYGSLSKWNRKKIYIGKSNILYRKLIREYPDSYLRDDAMYNLAESFEVYKKDQNLAYLEYKRLVEEYPKSYLSKKARKKLKILSPPSDDLVYQPEPENGKIVPASELNKARYGGLSLDQAMNGPQVLVTKVDYWSTSEWSRVVINTKNEIRYRFQALGKDPENKKGQRIFIDLNNSFIPPKFNKKIAANDGIIKRLRIAQFDKKTTRVVLDLMSFSRIKVFDFKLPNQNKIVFDILGESVQDDRKSLRLAEKRKSHVKAKKPSNFKGSVHKGKYDPKDAEISLQAALGLKVKRIVIDPGHGGRDPGAVGNGMYEKTVVLKLAKLIRSIFKKRRPDLEIFLTRDKDVFLGLEARTAFANQKMGDLFVSLHINASKDKRAKGIETYFLNLTTDNESLALAAKENQSTLKSISSLQTILNDLMTSAKIQESSQLADTLQTSMLTWARKGSKVSLKNLGVKQAPFVVLLGAEMPSILIEAGFITNPREAKLLKSSKFLYTLAEGIYLGIENYIKLMENPPLAQAY